MTSTPTTAYAKLAHVPVGAAFRITSGAYKDHVCLYRRVLMDFAVEVLIRKKKGLEVVSRHDSPSDYHPPTTLEPAVLKFDPALYNIAELPAMFAPLPPLFDTAGRLQDNSDGWEVRNPEPGITVCHRTPTYYDECDGPPPPPAPLDIQDMARQIRASERGGYFGTGGEGTFLADMEIPAETPGIDNNPDGPNVCAACIHPGPTLKRCSCCKALGMHTYYCNPHCQRKHRKTHKREKANLPLL
jgi:hypothetical protein